jgi:hypothetical protein
MEGVGRRLGQSGFLLDIGTNSLNGREHNVLFRNDGDESFTEVGWINGAGRIEDARGVATLDADGDGNLDILLRNYASPAALLKNRGRSGHWVGFELSARTRTATPWGHGSAFGRATDGRPVSSPRGAATSRAAACASTSDSAMPHESTKSRSTGPQAAAACCTIFRRVNFIASVKQRSPQPLPAEASTATNLTGEGFAAWQRVPPASRPLAPGPDTTPDHRTRCRVRAQQSRGGGRRSAVPAAARRSHRGAQRAPVP